MDYSYGLRYFPAQPLGKRDLHNPRAGPTEGRLSEVYRRRLARVREERDTPQTVVAYVRSNWHSASIFNEAGFETIKRDKVISLAQNIDVIFLTAFFAAFEGMLHEHMSQHHPGSLVPENAGAAFLIDRVAVSQPQRITVAVCDGVH